MRSLKRFAQIIIFIVSLSPGASANAAVDQITLFIPAFEGPGALGQNVATVLNLQIWQTLRRSPWPYNPENLDFGKGLIIWDKEPLKSQSHLEAERMAMSLSVLAQMVFWGKAYPYGNGVAVQANMSIPEYNDFRDKQLEIWNVLLRGRNIKVDIPRRRFEMSSIILRREIIDRYSLPTTLKIYKDRVGGEPIGEVGNAYIGIQFEQGLAKVRSGDTVGWVRIPELGRKSSEIVDFVAGVIRTFRGDWQGAASSMRRVIENSSTKTPLKIDAYLYRGMALERLGKDGRGMIEKAYQLNPYSRITLQYLIMSDLSSLSKLENIQEAETKRSKIIGRLKELIINNLYLFPENDRWISKVLNLIDEITSG